MGLRELLDAARGRREWIGGALLAAGLLALFVPLLRDVPSAAAAGLGAWILSPTVREGLAGQKMRPSAPGPLEEALPPRRPAAITRPGPRPRERPSVPKRSRASDWPSNASGYCSTSCGRAAEQRTMTGGTSLSAWRKGSASTGWPHGGSRRPLGRPIPPDAAAWRSTPGRRSRRSCSAISGSARASSSGWPACCTPWLGGTRGMCLRPRPSQASAGTPGPGRIPMEFLSRSRPGSLISSISPGRPTCTSNRRNG